MTNLLEYIARDMGLDPSEVDTEPVDSKVIPLDGYKE